MATILVIEDDGSMRSMLRQMLERAGHEVETAENGKDAMPLVRKGHVDVVVTDMIMPEQEGIETICTIRKEAPDVKVIAMSGGGRSNNLGFLSMAERVGAHRSFIKPIDRREFVTAVGDLAQG